MDRIIQIGNLFPDSEGFKNRTSGRVYSSDGLAPTLNTAEGGGRTPYIMETNTTICLNSKVDGKQPSVADRIYDTNGIAVAVTSGWKQNVAESPKRIRKLTPRECFRLMSVSEENIDKIQATGISNSQQYKLAGNSIDVNVLTKIFQQLFRFNDL